MNILRRIWNKCTTPSSRLQKRDQQRQAQFLASLLFFMLIFGFVNEFIVDPLIDPDPPNPNLLNSRNITFAIVLFAYILSRTRYFVIGSGLVVIFFWVGVFSAVLGPIEPVLLHFLIVPVIFANMFLPLSLALIAAVLNCVSLFLIPVLDPDVLYSDLPILFLFLSSGLLIFALYHRDTLEQDRRELLIESEERYRTLLETVFEGIIILQDEQIITVNQGFKKIFVCSQEAATQHHVSHFIPQLSSSRELREYSEPIETKGMTLGGHPLHLEIICKQYIHHEKATEMVAIRDISDRKRAAEALQQAQRLDSIGILAGGIAHDFNNILTAVSTQMSLAEMKLPANSTAGTHLEKAKKSTAVASELTRQLLAYAGKGSLNIGMMDLNAVVQETTTIVDDMIPEKVLLHQHLTHIPLHLSGDRNQIQQVILNILINASDAMEDSSGSIQVLTDKHELSEPLDAVMTGGKIELPVGTYAILSIQDTGVGMSEETRQRIFDPFFSTKKKGHGLGLSAAMGLINAHGGTIFVESNLGEGTTFTIWLPTIEEDTKMIDTNGLHVAASVSTYVKSLP